MDYEIRPMRVEEIKWVMAVARSMHSEGVYRDYPLAEARTEFILGELIPNELVLSDGVYVEGFLVGMVVAEIVEDLWAEVNVVYDHAFYVLPEYRRGRIGIALLKRLEEWAIARHADMTRISVYAGVANDHVASILDKIGYARSGTLHVKEHRQCVPA